MKQDKVKKVVVEYFNSNTETKVMAKDLMPQFIKAGIFQKNQKDELPIRDLLREL